MSVLSDKIAARRQALARLDGAAALAMADAYRGLLFAAEERLADLLASIDAARAAGTTISRHWLYQSDRYRSLIRQLAAQLDAFGLIAAGEATQAQRLALMKLAPDELLRAALGPFPPGVQLAFASIDPEALAAMIGFAGDGSPLADLFAALGADGVAGAREALVRGVGLGYGAERVARDVRSALGITLLRATTISRTEMHRAYREGTRQAAVANDHLLEGWVWRAARDGRTCPACWAMDGRLFPTSQIMPAHIACRCALVPRARSYADILGDPTLPDSRVPLRTGEAAFAKLSWSRQREILGPGHHDLYRAGMPLSEMVHEVPNRTWGPAVAIRPLRDLAPPVPIQFGESLATLARRRADLGITVTAIARQLRVDTVAVTRLEAGRGTAAEQLRYRMALDRLTQGQIGSLSRAA